MISDDRRRELARGEAISRIHWGADPAEVLELLRTSHRVEGPEADAMLVDAFTARRSAIRKKAWIALVFAAVGLAVPAAYFAIQGFVGFTRIGWGPPFMVSVGLASLALAGRSIYRLITGEASGPV